jgi:hypothetical protein
MARTATVIKLQPAQAPRGLAAMVDRLGEIETAMLALAEEANAIKSKLKAKGVGTYEGESYYSTVAERSIADRIDREKLFEMMDRKALIRAKVVIPGGSTLACSTRPF